MCGFRNSWLGIIVFSQFFLGAAFGQSVQRDPSPPSSVAADVSIASRSETSLPPALLSLDFSSSLVTGGSQLIGSVNLVSPAPIGGVQVTLRSSSAIVSVPSSVTIDAGNLSGSFTGTTLSPASASQVDVIATLGTSSAPATLTINSVSADSVTTLFFNPPTVTQGHSATGTVIISQPAPVQGLVVTLSRSSTSVSIPGSVTVSAGKTSATFFASTMASSATGTLTITASLNGAVNNTLRVIAPATGTTSEQIILGGETTSADFPLNNSFMGRLASGADSGYLTSMNLQTVSGITTTAARPTYSTYTSEASTFGQVRDTFVDPAGNVYACGLTDQRNLATTSGALQTGFAGVYRNAFVAKFSPAGSVLALTYFGGTNPSNPSSDAETMCYAIAVDSSGFVYISGRTSASVFRQSSGAFQTTYGGGNPVAPHYGGDFFVAKLRPNMAGPAPVWCTFVGGMQDDMGRGRLAVDSQGNVIVGGAGQSTSNFPVGPGQTRPNLPAGSNFGVVVKISSDGTKLLWTKFFFGTILAPGSSNLLSNTSGATLVDAANNIYVCGFTTASDFVAKSGGSANSGFQTSVKGPEDAYVAKLSPSGQVLALTLLGGSGAAEECKALARDSEGNIIVLTPTASSDYPTTAGAFSRSLNGATNIAVTKFTPDLQHIVFSTQVGGSGRDTVDATRLELDSNENIWFAFATDSGDLAAAGVVTSNAFQTTLVPGGRAKTCAGGALKGCTSVAFVKLSADGSKILYGSYLGGSAQDNPRTIRYRKN